jgi:hypothetical protein
MLLKSSLLKLQVMLCFTGRWYASSREVPKIWNSKDSVNLSLSKQDQWRKANARRSWIMLMTELGIMTIRHIFMMSSSKISLRLVFLLFLKDVVIADNKYRCWKKILDLTFYFFSVWILISVIYKLYLTFLELFRANDFYFIGRW